MSEMTIEDITERIARLEAELQEAKAQRRALRANSAKAKAEPRECACGCGAMTRGGDFLPGHDAKLRGRLLAAIRAGGSEGESALASLLTEYPSLLHGQSPEEVRQQLGADARKKEAQVARRVEAQAKRDAAKAGAKAKKSAKARVDTTEAMQGTKSPTVARNGGAIRLAKQRAASPPAKPD